MFSSGFFFSQQLFPSGEISNPWLEHKAVSAGLGSLKTPPWLAPCEAVTALTSQELQGGTGMLLKSAPFRRELGMWQPRASFKSCHLWRGQFPPPGLAGTTFLCSQGHGCWSQAG